jgi:hypothetical protein
VRAIGSSLRLKQRFGSGYQLSVSVLPARSFAHTNSTAVATNAAAVKRLFKVRLLTQIHKLCLLVSMASMSGLHLVKTDPLLPASSCTLHFACILL